MSAGIKNLSEYPKPHRPVKAVQFGGGVFLRGFFDWMLQKANDAGAYDGNAVIIRAKTGGEDPLAAQNFLYTHISRDAAHCDATLIDSIETSVNPKDRPEAFFALARSAGLEIVVSNTTEAGIVYHPCPFEENRAPDSYPARLARFLYERYRAGQGGLLILPCELIENNGRALRSAVERHAADWSLPEGFLAWLDRECSFRNTLVDRIVSGAPETPVLLPYADGAVNTGEFFHLWAIEGPPDARLPFAEAGLNVKWVDDVDEYRTLKVRILNGARTRR